MHIGRKVLAVGLAAVAVGAATGTALAASGGSSAAQPATASVEAASAVKADVQSPALVKMTMTQLTAKLGVSEKQMVIALDDMKMTVVNSKKLSHDAVQGVMIKVLASDLGISGAAATWAVEEIDGGYVPTYVNWGFGN